jgi:hypothetical protein
LDAGLKAADMLAGKYSFLNSKINQQKIERFIPICGRRSGAIR